MKKTVFLLIVCACLGLYSCRQGSQKPAFKKGQYAVYSVETPKGYAPHPVDTVKLVAGAVEEGKQWFEMIFHKWKGIYSQTFAVKMLVNKITFTQSEKDSMKIYRYMMLETNDTLVEYSDTYTGMAAIPTHGFRKYFIPTAIKTIPSSGTFFSEGKLFGMTIKLIKSGVDQNYQSSCDKAHGKVKVELRSDLLIGTCFNVKEVPPGRLYVGEYKYEGLTKADYEACLQSGYNWFNVSQQTEQWLKYRNCYLVWQYFPLQAPYPEMFYRSNFLGRAMFIDEPAARLNMQFCESPELESYLSPENYADLLKARTRETINSETSGKQLLARELKSISIPLGDMDLKPDNLPAWEEISYTAYYQLAEDIDGIVDECRYTKGMYPQRLNAIFGTGIPCTEEGGIRYMYQYMRGAARNFNKDWGMAIYGQMDSTLSFKAMKIAYDIGARHIWLWAADHQHHVPFLERLSLARRISAYAASRPKRNMTALKKSATVAIVLPYGYHIHDITMYREHFFPLDRKNETGKTFFEVLQPAVRMIEKAATENKDYDVLNDDSYLKLDGYFEVYKVGKDGVLKQIIGNKEEIVNLPPLKPFDSAPQLNVTITPEKGETVLKVELKAEVKEAANNPVQMFVEGEQKANGEWINEFVIWAIEEPDGNTYNMCGLNQKIQCYLPGIYKIKAYTYDNNGRSSIVNKTIEVSGKIASGYKNREALKLWMMK